MIRCIARQVGNQWEAYSLEFGLAVQAETLELAQAKMHDMIAVYVVDAHGIDHAHRAQLLSCRASLGIYALYYRVKLLKALSGKLEAGKKAYSERIGQKLAYV